MPKRSRNTDTISRPVKPNKSHRKNPAAVALGREGGLKGGKARMAGLSKAERQLLARKAAEARWRKKK